MTADAQADPEPAALPLAVKSIAVSHYATGPEGDVPMGVLGKDSFAPKLKDKVTVVATLSKSAYTYLIAFRPDGKLELCYPDGEDELPQTTAKPRYPMRDDPQTAYGLREGTGLWAFAVVASEEPLPPYRNWIAKHEPKWKPQPAPKNAVWWYDGAFLETFLPGQSGTRAKGEVLTGPAAAIGEIAKWIDGAGCLPGVLAFGVGPEK